MNVASLELCKELYELTHYKWEDDGYRWYCLPIRITKGSSPELDYSNWQVKHVSFRGNYSVNHYPAYTLGYLLRKLPPTQQHESLDLMYYLNVEADNDGEWSVSYDHRDATLYFAHADTPEDATTKLCIELIKQGVLKS